MVTKHAVRTTKKYMQLKMKLPNLYLFLLSGWQCKQSGVMQLTDTDI